MKVRLSLERISEIVTKLCGLASGDIAPNFQQPDQLLIEANKKKVIFRSCNGRITAQGEVTVNDVPTIGSCEPGKCMVIASTFGKVIKQFMSSLPDGDHLLLMVADKEHLHIIPQGTKNKTEVSIGLSAGTPFPELVAVEGLSVELDVRNFCNGVKCVERARGDQEYTPVYQMVHIDFIPDAMRLVCGDGSIFRVFTIQDRRKQKTVAAEDHPGYNIPAPQASRICRLMDNMIRCRAVFDKDGKVHRFDCDGGQMSFTVEGIPKQEYLPYNEPFSKIRDAHSLVDINKDELGRALGLVAATVDSDLRKEGDTHSVRFILDSASKKLTLKSDHGRHDASAELEVRDCNLPDGSSGTYEAEYAVDHLFGLVSDCPHNTVRLRFSDPDQLIFLESVDINGGVEQQHEETLNSFFTSVAETRNHA